jgi:hypothetical protein
MTSSSKRPCLQLRPRRRPRTAPSRCVSGAAACSRAGGRPKGSSEPGLCCSSRQRQACRHHHRPAAAFEPRLSPAPASLAVKGSAAAPSTSGTTSMGNLSSLLRGSAGASAGGTQVLEEQGEELEGPAAAEDMEVEAAATRWAPLSWLAMAALMLLPMCARLGAGRPCWRGPVINHHSSAITEPRALEPASSSWCHHQLS